MEPRICKVKNLITLLEKVPKDWFVIVNRVGNLSILKKALEKDEYKYVGWIDLLWNELNIFDDDTERVEFIIEEEE